MANPVKTPAASPPVAPPVARPPAEAPPVASTAPAAPPPVAPTATFTIRTDDPELGERLAHHARDLVAAIRDMRDAVAALIDESRADPGERRDGTAAAGHVVDAIGSARGLLPGPELNALRWALDGPRADGDDPHRNHASMAVAGVVLNALEHGRRQTANAIPAMRRAAEVWPKHRVWRTAVAELDALDRQDVAATASEQRAAHTERLAKAHRESVKPRRAPPPIVDVPDEVVIPNDPPVS